MGGGSGERGSYHAIPTSRNPSTQRNTPGSSVVSAMMFLVLKDVLLVGGFME